MLHSDKRTAIAMVIYRYFTSSLCAASLRKKLEESAYGAVLYCFNQLTSLVNVIVKF